MLWVPLKRTLVAKGSWGWCCTSLLAFGIAWAGSPCWDTHQMPPFWGWAFFRAQDDFISGRGHPNGTTGCGIPAASPSPPLHAASPPWELPGRWCLQNPPKNPFLEKNEGRGVPARCRRPHCTPNKGARSNQGVIRADVSQGPHCREGKLILGAAGNGTVSQRRGGQK